MTASAVVVPLTNQARSAVQPPAQRAANTPLAQVRAARGWSQLQVIRSLIALAERWGWLIASENSLKVQLSRWENGATPSQTYQVLLSVVLRATPVELGFGRADRPAAPVLGQDVAVLADRVQALETLVIQLSARLGAVAA
ncbi:XRE family transcriptional regulator [Streptomyces sp. NPDC000851]